ncbi:hypothetical protein [Millisia brevis]|uniref:hypothetical protein n=1 Tax=Millisia brevis TaxID=264148 RepID=UPI0012EEC764|nr:hypothetical protein [Millisia brevis]
MSRRVGRRTGDRRRLLRIVATAAIGLTLTACARIPEPGSTSPRGESRQVVIGVGADEASAVVARLYAGILSARGTDVRLDVDPRQRQRSLADLDAGALTLVPESMGDLVDHLEPLWRLDVPDADAEATFVELSRALPIGLSVGDFAESATLPAASVPADLPASADPAVPGLETVAAPPSATGAPETPPIEPAPTEPAPIETTPIDTTPIDAPAVETTPIEPAPERPNNVIPVFRSGELDSDQILALNVIAGELTTADVEAMLDQIDSGRSIGEVTGTWMAERS